MADIGVSNVASGPADAPRSALLIVFLVVFIDLLGFGIVLPLLPLYGDIYVGALIGKTTGFLHGAILGLMMSTFSLMQFLGAPIWGQVSDRIGRRPVLLIGFAALSFFSQHPGATGYSAALLSLLALVLGWFLLPETRRPDSASARRKWLDLTGIGQALRSPALGPVILVFFLATLGFGSF